MEFLLSALICSLVFYLYRSITYRSRKIAIVGEIHSISLSTIKEIICPEISVSYKYYYDGGVYYNRAYYLMRDLLDRADYRIYHNSLGLACLEMDGKQWIGIEHIEAFLIEKNPVVKIFIDPVEPFHSTPDIILESEKEEIYT